MDCGIFSIQLCDDLGRIGFDFPRTGSSVLVRQKAWKMGAAVVQWYDRIFVSSGFFLRCVVFFCALLAGSTIVGDWTLAVSQRKQKDDGLDAVAFPMFRSFLEILYSYFLWMNFHRDVDGSWIKIRKKMKKQRTFPGFPQECALFVYVLRPDQQQDGKNNGADGDAHGIDDAG